MPSSYKKGAWRKMLYSDRARRWLESVSGGTRGTKGMLVATSKGVVMSALNDDGVRVAGLGASVSMVEVNSNEHGLVFTSVYFRGDVLPDGYVGVFVRNKRPGINQTFDVTVRGDGLDVRSATGGVLDDVKQPRKEESADGCTVTYTFTKPTASSKPTLLFYTLPADDVDDADNAGNADYAGDSNTEVATTSNDRSDLRKVMSLNVHMVTEGVKRTIVDNRVYCGVCVTRVEEAGSDKCGFCGNALKVVEAVKDDAAATENDDATENDNTMGDIGATKQRSARAAAKSEAKNAARQQLNSESTALFCGLLSLLPTYTKDQTGGLFLKKEVARDVYVGDRMKGGEKRIKLLGDGEGPRDIAYAVTNRKGRKEQAKETAGGEQQQQQ
jgi:hypothetical protein